MKIVYIAVFLVLIFLIAITIRYFVAFMLKNNNESLNFKIKCLKLDQEIQKLKDYFKDEKVENNNVIVRTSHDVIFVDELAKLDEEHKKYYDEIINYVSTLKDVNVNTRKSYESLTYGKRKTIAKIVAVNGSLIVKFNFGKIKVNKEVEPLLLKTIKIEIKSEKELELVKKQLNTGYIKQSGQLKVEMEN